MKPRKKRKETDHSGATFDSFLEQEVCEKRSKPWSQLDRLLSPQNVSVTLDTITGAAKHRPSRSRCKT